MEKAAEKPPVFINVSDYTGPDRRAASSAKMRAWRIDVDRRLDNGAEVMKYLRAELAENTATTKQVQSDTSELVTLLKSFHGAMHVLDLLGKLAKPLGYIAMAGSALYGLYVAVKGGGGMK